MPPKKQETKGRALVLEYLHRCSLVQEEGCPGAECVYLQEAGVLISFQELIVCALEASDISQLHVLGVVDY